MNKRRLSINSGIIAAVFMFILFFAVPLQTEAAWVTNSDGTRSYYTSSGKLLTDKWLNDGKYYINKQGILQTGWMYKGQKWYYFNSRGRLVTKTWIRSGEKKYYASAEGPLYTSGRYKIGKYYYCFNARGLMQKGLQTCDGEKYYFSKQTGRMFKKKWVKIGSSYYYFGAKGNMIKSKWIGLYYVNSSGRRVCNSWKGKKYLGSDGQAVKGLQQIDGIYYYFNTNTYEKVTSQTIEVGGITYKFDSKGHGTQIGEAKAPTTSVSVEKTYYTDVYVDDETLLAAIIYCEAGNQSYAGKQAVGMVIMNRVYDSHFPNKIREVIYAKSQFTPARDGSLTRALSDPARVTDECKKAAKAVLKKYASYTEGTKVYLKVSSKKISFPYLFFMTKGAYSSLGLTASYTKIGDHVFFKNWC